MLHLHADYTPTTTYPHHTVRTNVALERKSVRTEGLDPEDVLQKPGHLFQKNCQHMGKRWEVLSGTHDLAEQLHNP